MINSDNQREIRLLPYSGTKEEDNTEDPRYLLALLHRLFRMHTEVSSSWKQEKQANWSTKPGVLAGDNKKAEGQSLGSDAHQIKKEQGLSG